jgi:uncharacterized integral membrane protein
MIRAAVVRDMAGIFHGARVSRLHPPRVKPDHPPTRHLAGMTSEPAAKTSSRRLTTERAARLRMVAAAALAVFGTVFAFMNLDEVDVNWILGTWSTPLIVVIAVAMLLGAAADRLLVTRSRRSKKKKTGA